MSQSVERSPLARLLVLDRGLSPQWCVASVTLASDIRPAVLGSGGFIQWPDVLGWLAAQMGEPAELEAVSEPLAWRLRVRGAR